MRTSGQQHGRRSPCKSFERPTCIRRSLVSTSFPSVIQQIHSLRASGVISSHTVCALGEDKSIFRTSAGILWTVPDETLFCIRFIMPIPYAPRALQANFSTVLGNGILSACLSGLSFVPSASNSRSTNRLLLCVFRGHEYSTTSTRTKPRIRTCVSHRSSKATHTAMAL